MHPNTANSGIVSSIKSATMLPSFIWQERKKCHKEEKIFDSHSTILLVCINEFGSIFRYTDLSTIRKYTTSIHSLSCLLEKVKLLAAFSSSALD